jgi:hypothetical protein
MLHSITNLAPQCSELFIQNSLVWGDQSWLVHTILLNLTKAQICLGIINDLCTSIGNLQNLQSLDELTLEQSEQLQTQLHNLAFQKACFNAHLSNNIQPLDIMARENVAASIILYQIPANVFNVSLV